MESAKGKCHYRTNKSIINDNKLECTSEYKLNDFNLNNMKRINNNNIIKDVLHEIQKVQDNINDELYELKNRNVNNKVIFKNEKNKLNKNDRDEINNKLNPKDNFKNNVNNDNIKKKPLYKDVPLTAFFK